MLEAQNMGTIERFFTTTPSGGLMMEMGGMVLGVGVVAVLQALLVLVGLLLIETYSTNTYHNNNYPFRCFLQECIV